LQKRPLKQYVSIVHLVPVTGANKWHFFPNKNPRLSQ